MQKNYIRGNEADGRERVDFTLDGAAAHGLQGDSVAGALGALGVWTLRRAPRTGAPRGAFCLMGVCQECLCQIDGARREACRTPLREGMEVETLG